MRVTNSERREVAARLRDMRKRMDGETPPQGVTQAASEYLLRIAGCVKLGSSGNLFNRLADLMDRPTCQLDGNPAVEYVICNRCGAFIKRDAVSDCCKVIPVRYCPNCGAEVVE